MKQIRERITASLPHGSLRRRMASGAFWSLVSAVATQGIGALASIVTARLLGKSYYGELGMVRSTIGLFDTFASLGLGLTANKFVAELRDADPAACRRILGLVLLIALPSGLIATAIMAIGAPAIVEWFLGAPQLQGYVRIGSLLLLMNAINAVQNGALAGFEAFRKLSRISAISSIAAAILGIVGVLVGGIQGAVWAWVIAGALNVVLFRIALVEQYRTRNLYPDYRNAWKERRIIPKFALPNMLSGALYAPAIWAANALLVNFPGGFGELGIYNATVQWQSILRFLPAQLLAASLPIMSSLQRDNSTGFSRSIDVSHSAISMLAVPAAILMIGVAGPIMALYGRDYTQGQQVLMIAVTTAAVMDLGSAAGTALQALGRMWLGSVMNATWAVLLVGTMFLWGRYHGAMGLASSYLVAYLALLTWGVLYIRKVLPPGMILRTFAGLALLLISVSILATLGSGARIAASIILALTSAAIFYFWLISPLVRDAVAGFFKRRPVLQTGKIES